MFCIGHFELYRLLVLIANVLIDVSCNETVIAKDNSSSVGIRIGDKSVSIFNENYFEPLPTAKLGVLLKSMKYKPQDYPSLKKNYSTFVSASIYIQKISAISEATASFKVQIYVSLAWVDPRLSFLEKPEVGSPSTFFQLKDVDDQRKLWIPPLYFPNVELADLPSVYAENSVVFLFADGSAALQFRVICIADCQMNFRHFPFDTQKCPVYLAVFGFYDNQITLKWDVARLFQPPDLELGSPIELNPKIQLAAWKLLNVTYEAVMDDDSWKAACSHYKTCLRATFTLKRKYEFYIIDTYAPTALIMFGACFSFWISPEHVPARVSLGLSLFLCLQTTSLVVRGKLPNVTYVKAVDYWLFFAQLLVFTALVEFIVAHRVLTGKLTLWKNTPTNSLPMAQPTEVETEAETGVKDDEKKRKQFVANMDRWSKFLFPAIFILFAFLYFVVCTNL